MFGGSTAYMNNSTPWEIIRNAEQRLIIAQKELKEAEDQLKRAKDIMLNLLVSDMQMIY